MNGIIEKIQKHKLVTILLGVGFIAVLAVLTVFGIVNDEPVELHLKDSHVYLEYGSYLPNNMNDYLDLENIPHPEEIKCISEGIDSFNQLLEVGDYDVKYQLNNAEVLLKITVQDTTAPEVSLLQNIKIFENHEIKYQDYVNIKDNSEYTFDIDDSNVKYDTVGTYNAIATVTDKYKNKTEMDIPVEIEKLNVDISKTSLTLLKNTKSQITVTTNSNKAIEYKSNNEDVASINNSGNITAKKVGKAVISATVDGKTVKCDVTVKEKETQVSKKTSTTNTSTSKTTTSKKNTTTKKSSDKTSATVYITNTGKSYHRGSCSSLRKSKIAISKSKAISQGYKACKRCHP